MPDSVEAGDFEKRSLNQEHCFTDLDAPCKNTHTPFGGKQPPVAAQNYAQSSTDKSHDSSVS
jgi:hypothetical protein